MLFRIVTSLLLAFSISMPLSADVLLIEEVRAAKNMDLPKNGQSKSAIQNKYGQPAAISGPVGDPPITRWQYDRFSVYFEYDLVITSVLHHGEVISQPESSNG